MANPNDRGFNTIQNSRVARRRKTETLQIYTVLGVAAMAFLIVIILAVMAVGGVVGNADNQGNNPSNEKIEWGTFTVITTDTLKGELVLVNQAHVYTFPATEDHLGKLNDKRLTHDPRVYMQSGLSDRMDATALDALDKMLVDFHTATGKDNVTLRYAYRSAQEQQDLVNSGKATIEAGYSDHHTGLGIELGFYRDGLTYDLAADPIYNWLFENCHKYGFVIRYPADKVEQTGIEDYAEYFRYVGVAHATYMKQNNLCLEEYITALKEYDEKKPLVIEAADGKIYAIYYVAVDGSATVKHPTNFTYTVSGTNEGGVVVTVDRSGKTADTSADTSAQSGTVQP